MPSTIQKSSYVGMSYADADRFLGSRDSVKIANNTWLERNRVTGDSHNSISVRLHSTYVVTYYSNGSSTVNTGGYSTPTTARRINQFSVLTVSLGATNKVVRLGDYWFETPFNFHQSVIIDALGMLTDTGKRSSV